MITSLIPIPGSKRSKKYNFLQPLPHQKRICEPFMGGAAKSLQTGLRPTLGESNACLRDIARVPTRLDFIDDFVYQYQSAITYLVEGIDCSLIHKFAKEKQAQKTFRLHCPEIADDLDFRWQMFTESLFDSIEQDDFVPGTYYAALKSCFGNVLRLNPKQTAFNVSWHVDKLSQALKFDPQDWCDQLRQQKWNPIIYDDYKKAIIDASFHATDTWMLIDPPYVTDSDVRQMSPCYPQHRVTTEAKAETFRLATDALSMACQLGFLKIDLCNYYSERLNFDVLQKANLYGYSVEMTTVGVCGALGNSNGRLEHGNRKDTRERPIEVVWTLKSLF